MSDLKQHTLEDGSVKLVETIRKPTTYKPNFGGKINLTALAPTDAPLIALGRKPITSFNEFVKLSLELMARSLGIAPIVMTEEMKEVRLLGDSGKQIRAKDIGVEALIAPAMAIPVAPAIVADTTNPKVTEACAMVKAAVNKRGDLNTLTGEMVWDYIQKAIDPAIQLDVLHKVAPVYHKKVVEATKAKVVALPVAPIALAVPKPPVAIAVPLPSVVAAPIVENLGL